MNKYALNRKRAKDLNHILKVFRVLRLSFGDVNGIRVTNIILCP